MLEVSTLQAVVLMMFNDAKEVSFRAIADRVRTAPPGTTAAAAAADAELRRTMQARACVYALPWAVNLPECRSPLRA